MKFGGRLCRCRFIFVGFCLLSCDLKLRSIGYKISEKEGAYFLTLQIVGWVDIFTRKTYRDIAIESLIYCQHKKGLVIFAYVIMSNHIHLFARSSTGDLSGTLRDFKSFTTKRFL